MLSLLALVAALQAVDGATPYRVHNVDDHRTINLDYSCDSKSHYTRMLKPGEHAKISCTLSSISAAVVSGDGITQATSVYQGSPTKKTLKKYRTFGVAYGDCAHHNKCDRHGKDSTTIFARYFDDAATGDVTNVDSTDSYDQTYVNQYKNHKIFMQEIDNRGNLRGTKIE
jgi:hypothetical protein